MTAPDLARRVFGIALAFFLIATVIGAGLRWQAVRPHLWFNYAHVLHAHSHVAFLGWVFNAFIALALRWFVPADRHPAYAKLVGVLMVAVLGMLVAFPLQGYAAVSIAFSTLHMVGAGVFAVWLWRNNRAASVARGPLRVALVFLLASGLGPLSLGPLAAVGLRDTPVYHLSVYFYLHAQYNGWFLFFLQATLLQSAVAGGRLVDEQAASRALRWLATGAVLTYAQSTLWLSPPAWVYAVAAVGGGAQLVGCGWLAWSLRNATGRLQGAVRVLAGLAGTTFFLKHLLQALTAWPALGALGSHRFVVIAFLHLVFLGVVTPAILAWAIQLGWMRDSGCSRVGLGLLLGSAICTELILIAVPFGLPAGFPLAEALLVAALGMVAGVGLLLGARSAGVVR
ncbi:hypothetical protein MASR2M8_07130 [Opitutaceae bacterium]